jgi:hypothetical protein
MDKQSYILYPGNLIITLLVNIFHKLASIIISVYKLLNRKASWSRQSNLYNQQKKLKLD